MNPHVSITNKDDYVLTFTISNINVSIINALRRTILSEIPIIIIRSMPYEKNDVSVHTNTSRLNNEILKQRLSCIPIHWTETLPLEDLREYELEIKKLNESDAIEFITTEEFVIKHKGTELSDSVLKQIFPANPITQDYILFARLRPKISEDIPGEELHITAKFSIGTAKENSMFNIASTCAYAMTPNTDMQASIWAKLESSLKGKGLAEDALEMERQNWLLSDGQRLYVQDSFDFIIETLGIFPNNILIQKALAILNEKLDTIQGQIESNSFSIQKTKGTIPYSYDLILLNEDYSIGKTLEYILYKKYFIDNKILSFIGFLKKHPHDKNSLIRTAFKEKTDERVILQYLKEAIIQAKEIFNSISIQFNSPEE